MLIICSSCATAYQMEPASLPPQGCQVRCLRCNTVWRAEISPADRLLAAAAAIAPAHQAAAAVLTAAGDAVGCLTEAHADALLPTEPAAEGVNAYPLLDQADAIVADRTNAVTGDQAEAVDQVEGVADDQAEAVAVDRAEAVAADRVLGADAATLAAIAAIPPEPIAETASENPPSEQNASLLPTNELQIDDGLVVLAIGDESDALSTAASVELPSDETHQWLETDTPSTAHGVGENELPIEVEADQLHEPWAELTKDAEPIVLRRSRHETASTRQRRTTKRRFLPRWPLSRVQAGIAALFLVDAILIGWRSDIVRALPQTASFYALTGLPVNLRGLAFDDVATTTEQYEGARVLVVEGKIVNDSHKVVRVPRLKFVMRNATSQEIYSWSALPSRTSLPPGETVTFRTRLASPPPAAHDLVLRFVTHRDIVATSH
jgi:predicted Zn finger-like uncharacterized protein